MKIQYLETYHYRKYKDYCSNKCINIVLEQTDKNDTERAELRGRYKGYLYGMKLFNSLLQRGKSVTNCEIYNHLKYHKSHCTTLYGEKRAVCDIMNVLVDD
jgi:hypothetical protein